MKSIKKLGIALALIAPCILAAPAVPAFEPLRETELEAQELLTGGWRTEWSGKKVACWPDPCPPSEWCCAIIWPGAA